METSFLRRPGYPALAYNHLKGHDPALPPVLFLGGFRSDRHGTKATHLEEFCKARGQEYIRFDYSGHGDSGGSFAEGTIESWRDDAEAILGQLIDRPAILAGSSMGGWIALLLALSRPEKVAGLVGIAAAPDFTRIMTTRFTDGMRAAYDALGYVEIPSDYSPEPYLITRRLIDSGNRLCLLDRQHALAVPLVLIQGKKDPDVDWHTPARIRESFPASRVAVHLVEDGDHSLSRTQDLALIEQAIISVCI